MKRTILALPLLLLSVTGCSDDEASSEEKQWDSGRFKEVSKETSFGKYDFETYVLADRVTGCQYVVTGATRAIALTPVINSDGKPYCEKVKK
ncbi:DUF6440 family protein [Bacillus subtilis]|uniref:DUF6440 family protein n=1 Tax=Bacillus subtilis TaxID=1423 RepID=UPI003CF3CCAE